jgi:hypothetical protein
MSYLTTQHGPFSLPITQYLKPPQGNMLFDILFVADRHKIGDYRQCQTDLNMARKNSKRVDYDYKVGDKVLLSQEGILRKAESPYSKKSHGQSQQFIQMELSGFNVEHNQKDLISGE